MHVCRHYILKSSYSFQSISTPLFGFGIRCGGALSEHLNAYTLLRNSGLTVRYWNI